MSTSLVIGERRAAKRGPHAVTGIDGGVRAADLIPTDEVGSVVVAMFLGLQTLTHIDGDRSRVEALFTVARPAAALWDAFARKRT